MTLHHRTEIVAQSDQTCYEYYILCFVFQVLGIFAILVFGFALTFMILFKSNTPFDDPWTAFVKTIVMMTSEFDYSASFNEEHFKNDPYSLTIVRIIFVIFMFLTSIVLMNLTIGIAVNDINKLKARSNIRRLHTKVEFLSTLDPRIFCWQRCKCTSDVNIDEVITLNIGDLKRQQRIFPSKLEDAILNIALKQKNNDEENDKKGMESSEIHRLIKNLGDLQDNVVEMKNHLMKNGKVEIRYSAVEC